MPRKTLIQIRKGQNSEWHSINPVLASGEPGYDFSNNYLKIGDGQTSWDDLIPIGGVYGSVYRNYKNIDETYFVEANDNVIFCHTDNSEINIYLHTAINYGGKELIIKNLGNHNVVILPYSPEEKIDNSPSFLLRYKNESVTILSNNQNWYLI